MITAEHAFTLSSNYENRNSYYQTEIECLSETIECACRKGEYQVEFTASGYEDEEDDVVFKNLMDKIANNLKDSAFRIEYNSDTGTFSIRWDGKMWK